MNKIAYIRSCVENNEAAWFFNLGQWECSSGFFKGFGLGLVWMPGQFTITIGCFAFGAVTGEES